MWRNFRILTVLTAAAASLPAQEQRRSRIDVEHYVINAEINENTQALAARAAVRFTPLEDNISTVTFELNNALNVARVTDAGGKQIQASRSQQDFTVRLNFDQPLVKGKAVTLTFDYDGRLTGSEDSPVYGIKFAAIHNDYAYLMYPSRWFPISGYTTDRYSSEMNITVAAGNRVIASGLETSKPNGDKTTYSFRFDENSFPGSIAVIRGDPKKVNSSGLTTNICFRGAEQAMADAYGQEAANVMTYFTATFGLPPYANLALVETEDGAPNGFSSPGVIFLNPRAIGHDVSIKLLANQISRQWWHALISPATRNHLWLTNGLAAYSELIYAEHTNGPGAVETQFHDMAVEALTVDNVPVIQAARLEDYSPELWALTGSKGAAVLNMLRFNLGDAKFFETLKQYVKEYAWKSVTTEDFKKAAEAVSQENLGYFFIEWIESSGAPEFKLEYTIFRTQKGFRVMGKVSQDLDTFRMPADLKIETEGNPEEKRIEVVGTSSEFSVDTFGKPKTVTIDPNRRLLRYSDVMRVAVAIRRGEQFAEVSEFGEALKEYQKALETRRNSSLAHYRIAEVFFLQNNYQSAANEFREVINGDLEPKWTEVWTHIHLGQIFDITGQRERAVNEYQLAQRTRDNTQGAQDEAAKYLKKPYERQKSALSERQ
jgi:tetratricopeptide (TPR) repeat protein